MFLIHVLDACINFSDKKLHMNITILARIIFKVLIHRVHKIWMRVYSIPAKIKIMDISGHKHELMEHGELSTILRDCMPTFLQEGNR